MSKDSSSKRATKAPARTEPSVLEKVVHSALLVTGTVLIFLIGQLVGIVMAVVLLQLTGTSADQVGTTVSDTTRGRFLAMFCIQFVTLSLLYAVHAYRRKPFLKSIGLQRNPQKSDISWAAAFYVVYLAGLFVLLPVLSVLIPQIDVEQAQQIGFSSPQGFEYVIIFVSLVILPAVGEEILFRGFMYKRLRSFLRIRYAMLLTSIVFGAAHLEFLGDNPLNWAAAIDTFLLSLFLIILVQKTGSLWSSIILHATKNTVAFTFLFII